MWCPRCEQGEVVKATIQGSIYTIFVCDECEATWFKEEDVGKKTFIDFGTYMKSIGREPLWSELKIVE